MTVRVAYLAQLRTAAGRPFDAVEVEDGCTVAGLLARLASSRPELRATLLGPDGRVQRTLLVFMGDNQASPEQVVAAGQEVTLMTPIAGG